MLVLALLSDDSIVYVILEDSPRPTSIHITGEYLTLLGGRM